MDPLLPPAELARARLLPFAVASGLAAAGIALAVAELLAGLNRTWRSPVLDVGDRLIDAAPPFVKEFAIDTFGTNDKPALLVGIGVILALYAGVVGVIALRHRFVVGAVGVGVFGAIGSWAATSRRAGAPWHVVAPSVLGSVAGIGALWLIHQSLELGSSERRRGRSTARRPTAASSCIAPASSSVDWPSAPRSSAGLAGASVPASRRRSRAPRSRSHRHSSGCEVSPPPWVSMSRG